MKQYIYKLTLDNIAQNIIENPYDATFQLCSDILSFLKNLPVLIQRFGFSSALMKLFIKILIRKNVLYWVIYDKNIASDGLISFGYCSHYEVRGNDAIIGPVNTNSKFQGMGFATFGLNSCLQALKQENKYNAIYIDTKEDNYAMQSVIKKSGFSSHIDYYERDIKSAK